MIRKLYAAMNMLGPNVSLQLQAGGEALLQIGPTTTRIHADKLELWADEIVGESYWHITDDRLRSLALEGYKFEYVTRTDQLCFFWALEPGKTEWHFYRMAADSLFKPDWIGCLLDIAGIKVREPITVGLDDAKRILRALRDRYRDDHPLVQQFNTITHEHSTPVPTFSTTIKGQRLVYAARDLKEARSAIDRLNQKAAQDLRLQIKDHIDSGRMTLADVLGPSDIQMQWDDEDVWKEIPNSLVMPKVNPFAPVEDQIKQAEVCMEASLRDYPTNHRAYFRAKP